VTATTTTCIEIRCNICGYALDEDEDGTVHFTSIAHAAGTYGTSGQLDEWLILADGYAICPDSDEEHRAARAADRAKKVTP
jgi:hypothetical protein